jgi:hypothetical protein
VKSDSFPHRMWKVTPLYGKFKEWLHMWWVAPLHIKCEEPLLSTFFSTSCVKSDSSPPQIWKMTLHKVWRVTPLHINCEEWFLSKTNLKSAWLLYMSNVKSDSSLHKFEDESSPHQMWRETPLTTLHIKSEEWLLSTSYIKAVSTLYVKSDSSPH